MGLSLPATLCRLAPPALRMGQRRMLQAGSPDIPEHVLRLAGVGPGKLRSEWSLPGLNAMFLPEFPHRAVPGQEHFQVDAFFNLNLCLVCARVFFFVYDGVLLFQVLGYIAKGSFGPILKVKDKTKQRTYAVKVGPKNVIVAPLNNLFLRQTIAITKPLKINFCSCYTSVKRSQPPFKKKKNQIFS